MTLTLDPRHPVLWRTPHSLQLGLDDPQVVLTGVTNAHERMLAALAVGLTREGLDLIGSESGLSVEQVAEFERAVRPALMTSNVTPSARVYIDGFGPTADRLEWRLREAGFEPHRLLLGTDEPSSLPSADAVQPGSDGATSFAVIVGDFVLDPERRGRWLRRDIPHLPLIFGDTSVTIGPFIEPGAGPCLYCLELARTENDPAWPVLASQLLGKTSSAQSPFAASEAATVATRMLLSRVRQGAARNDTVRGPDDSGASATTVTSSIAITVNTDTGEHRETGWLAHPQCACAGLTSVVAASNLPGIWKESSLLSAPRATQTRRGEAVCVPA